ncbi:MAG TPA: hypothetical protein VNO50_16980 [Pyrinomonadaceae bacterium]|nr:hypothetical protein [Pyrinomonadaceae bacterium]
MKRISAYSTAFVVLLAWTALPFAVHVGQIRLSQQAVKLEAKALPRSRPTVTIVFRGLMVFHPDPERKYFEAGILQAQEHKFRIQVRENSPTVVSTYSVPLGPFGSLERDVWSFEFASSGSRRVSFYRNGFFDRQRGIGDERDFRWAVDLEGREFYNQQLATKTDQLSPVFRVTSGEFYTKSKTRPLMRNQGDGTFQYFGSAADEIAADAFLNSGDVVLRSGKSGKEILRLKQKPNTTYEIIIENEPLAHLEHVASTFTHFQYYYRLIAKPKAEWYEFKLASDAVSSATADSGRERFMVASYLIPVSPGTDRIPCMPAGVGRRKKSLR